MSSSFTHFLPSRILQFCASMQTSFGDKRPHQTVSYEVSRIFLSRICIVFVFVSMGWSLLPNALRPFRIYCAPPNLGITRTWICGLNFAQKPIFQAWGSLTSLKSQARDPQLKVSSGGLVLRSFTSWENPWTSVGFELASLGSRGEYVTARPPRPTLFILNIICILEYIWEIIYFTSYFKFYRHNWIWPAMYFDNICTLSFNVEKLKRDMIMIMKDNYSENRNLCKFLCNSIKEFGEWTKFDNVIRIIVIHIYDIYWRDFKIVCYLG